MRNKKITNLLIVFGVMMALCMSACSKSSVSDEDSSDAVPKYSEKTIQKLLDKYEEGEMTEKDWSKALDQMEAAYNSLYEDMSKALKKCDYEDEFYREMSAVQDSYELVGQLYDMLGDSEYEMGEKNYERFEKIAEKGEKRISKLRDKADEKWGNKDDNYELQPAEEIVVTDDYYDMPAAECAPEAIDEVAVEAVEVQ